MTTAQIEKQPNRPLDFKKLAWPAGEKALELVRSGRSRTLLHGVPGSARAFLLAFLHSRLEDGKPWLLVAPTREEALRLQDDLATWLLAVPVLLCPSWETLPQDVETPDPELVGDRQAVFYRLLQGEPCIVVAPLLGALQAALPPGDWLEEVLILRKGREAPADLKERLQALGYERVPQVVRLGQFAARGGILDLASPGSPSGPVRLEFFGDTLESVRPLDILNQRSSGDLEEIHVFPAHEVVLREVTRRAMRSALREKAQGEEVPARWAKDALELFDRTSQFPGWEWQALGALKERACLFDYLPDGARVVILEPLALARKEEELEEVLAGSAAQAKENGSDLFPVEGLFQGSGKLPGLLERKGSFGISHLLQDLFGKEPVTAEVTGRSLPPYLGKFQSFVSDLKGWLSSPSPSPLEGEGRGEGGGGSKNSKSDGGSRQATRVMLWCHNKGERERISELLRERGIDPKATVGLSLPLGEVEQGFTLDDLGLVVLPDHDLFRRYRGGRRRLRAVPGGKPLGSLSEIAVGDWAVHVDCGICLYRGLTPLTVDGATREYIQLEFADSERIYLPTDQIALVQRYIGSEGSPVLSKLGGEQWGKAKAKVKREIEAVARELMALYSTRQVLHKKPVARDTPFQHEFEDSFPYELTPGQHSSLKDIKRDMESERVMDRLLCGDVGYGKTEVAMRAAFKAVQAGRQVAVLVPTTILAQQHDQTFRDRMDGYPVEVRMVSRFKSAKEIREALEEVRRGKVDILIGTHRLLGKDVKFAKLGLLIIDEEHRFGVSQKEKLKHLKHDVDVLTLTATPIPRTLHMSLSGIREVSVIDTAPKNRRTVLAQVSPEDTRLIAEAVRRELAREGQVFFVHNHVKDIERVADRLHKLVPEAKLAVAHGQLNEHELESVMMDFVNRESQVLVCTSIVESGLDMPNVNTLIVDRADAFGLAQLYQLKGRVGRTDRQAYAYFFYPRHITLRELAQKRLEVLQEFSALGSGMHIAMKDMEIRGAGNVLGTRQHGNMDAIGFDLYSRMLSQEIAHLKGEEAEADFTPQLSLGVTAFFPKDYIAEEGVKIEFYRRLAEIGEEEKIGEVEEELKDRFGPLPPEAQMLLQVAVLRPRAKRQGIQRLEAQGGWVSLQWHPDHAPDGELVGKWMKQWPPTRIRFSPKDPNTISFRVAKEDPGPEKRMEQVVGLLRSLEKDRT